MSLSNYSSEEFITAILSHPINYYEGFEKTLLGKEIEKFIKWRCVRAKPEMIDKLYKQKIYHRAYEILEEIKSQIESKDKSSLEIIQSYERTFTLFAQLNNISGMRFLTSIAKNKPKGTEKEYQYVTMNFYTGFQVQPKYSKRNYRILNSLSEYQDPKDPQIAIDAEKKYFDDCLDQFDKLREMPMSEFINTIK